MPFPFPFHVTVLPLGSLLLQLIRIYVNYTCVQRSPARKSAFVCFQPERLLFSDDNRYGFISVCFFHNDG